MFGLIIALVMAAVPLLASAGHSWGNYHWGRTSNPFTVQLDSNLSGNWPGHLSTASSDWSQSSVLDTTLGLGGINPKRCTPTSGRVEVCNAAYGRTGWLGLASIWASGEHITQGTAKMNDTYFNMSAYNTAAWRQFVMCQEVGHTFGLGHTDETHTNANQGTCMDYTNDPDWGTGGASETDANNEHPNPHDYDHLSTIYTHTDSTTTVAPSSGQTAGQSGVEIPDPSGPEQGGVAVFVTELGGDNRVITFVIWADANVIRAANANANAPIANDSGETVVEEGYPVDEGEHDHEAQTADADGNGLSDGDEGAAGTDPLTAEESSGNVDTGDSSPGSAAFPVGSTVITTEAVNLRAGPSRQAELVTELAVGTVATVTGPVEQAQGLNWVPVTVETPDGTLAGYVAADFITPAEPAV